ncbi:uncharacterized protein TRUGW13939_08757 [Talaromyces rugulosus]|uniref:Uncharacterized protein n=1 Tax=Talaromyces rugulosus TaxID=121627 RepID=A0A7H8R7K3_TALRU|nr:uncharacterized protein TRUGW13939_08757 [Talaromyces rugulosus]QKX61605.1 hypothetical protein TRUGW13939_08757 [Talaromyces rugulosus]
MSWQSSVNSGVGEDLDAFLESLIDFDTSYIESPEPFNSGGDRQPSHGTEDNVDNNDPKVLTIMASISSILRHLETERRKGNARPSVAIKLKDLNEQKSITLSVPVLHSPTTTAVSSIGSLSRTPSRSASPEAFLPEEGHTARTNTVPLLPEEATPPTVDSTLYTMTSPSAVPDGCLLSLSEDVLPSTLPVLEAANPEQAIESPPGLVTPEATTADLSALSGENTESVIAQHRRRTTLTHTAAVPGERAQDMLSCTTALAPIHYQQACELSQTSQASTAASSKKMGNEASDKPKQERSKGWKRISLESESRGIIKRPRLETLDLATLLHNTDKFERVKELTADQDPSLVYKMVRNARAILTEPAIEGLSPSAPININAVIPYNNSRYSPSLQEDIMQQFCDTVRQIEWVETLTFRSMVEYRILFVQLYQQYLSLQKMVDTKKGERRITVAKERLYTMLYPNIAKRTRNGCLSDEWEKFNRCIRRGKQWYTIASELGIGILHRMPSSIRHTWVEQKLQTKTQLYLWIKIVKLLT